MKTPQSKSRPQQTPEEILEEYAEQYVDLGFVGFTEAQSLEEISLLTSEALTAIYYLLEGLAELVEFPYKVDGQYERKAVPLSKIKQLFGRGEWCWR